MCCSCLFSSWFTQLITKTAISDAHCLRKKAGEQQKHLFYITELLQKSPLHFHVFMSEIQPPDEPNPKANIIDITATNLRMKMAFTLFKPA